ncbi:MAG: hypothetical protein IPL70_14345 [Uliginosibacterium sp.]|nr:hypothetical protein [Uliginosibacterium sp.]
MFDDATASIAAQRSGTATNPITLMAFPGDEGRVTLDSQKVREGIHTNGQDYWQIHGLRLVNSLDWGISSSARTSGDLNYVHTQDELTVGWRIENCLIRDVVASAGGNSGGIGMWHTKDWIVRNNRFALLVGGTAAAAHAFGTAHSLFEHNYVEAKVGVYLKDHMLRRLNPRGTYFEYELRYNMLNVSAAFVSSVKGMPNVESGSNYVHHNISYGSTWEDNYTWVVNGSATVPGAEFRFEHNVVDMTGAPYGVAFEIYGSENVRSKGNILLTPGAYAVRGNADPNVASNALRYSDYNLFENAVFIMDSVYEPTRSFIKFWDLGEWQAARTTSAQTLKVNNPDSHSKVVTASATFVNRAARDYRYKTGSPALNLLGQGNHAGPYQTGSEMIGTLPSYSAGQ